MIIHNPILTGSFTVNGTDVASITSSAASITAINSYTASQNILNGTYATTGSNTFKNPQTINSNLIVTGSITAQTLVVQTVSSSVIYSSGSNVFGNNIANTQVMTGSVTVTGSLAVVTTGTEFQVNANGVKFGNVIGDAHSITGSVGISGSLSGVGATFRVSADRNLATRFDSNIVLSAQSDSGAPESLRVYTDTFRLFTATTAGGLTERLTISNIGNVGIGVTPKTWFTADYNIKVLQIGSAGSLFNLDVTSSNLRLYLSNNSYVESTSATQTYVVTGAASQFSQENGAFFFRQAPSGTANTSITFTTPMTITSGGDVLIGTTSTASAYSKVTIRGTNQGLAIQDAATNNYRAMYSQSGALYFYNGTNEGYLSSGGTWVNASDITLKKDVKEIEYGMAEVMKLKPKWYRMIEDNLEQIGFIAQDVEEILPELVSTSERGMKGLSYGQLTAVLVKAIQELQAQITELKNK